MNFNYAYSKAMDESEGLDQFNFNTNTSIRFQEDPQNLRRNYGPADWSVKHYISANYVWTLRCARRLWAMVGHRWWMDGRLPVRYSSGRVCPTP